MTFLQGQLTSRKNFPAMFEKLANGLDCSTELINYKSSGESFNNFLHIIPLREGRIITHYLGILEDISQSKAGSIDVEYEDSTTSKIDNESVANLPSQSNTATDQDCWDKKREDLISFLNSSCPFSSIPFPSTGAIQSDFSSDFSSFSSMMNSSNFWEEAAILNNEDCKF